MEIPIVMILACRLLPFRANRLANIIAGGIMTLVNGFLTFVPPLAGWGRPPAFPEYVFFATIETVCTLVIIWQAWTWSGGEDAVSSERVVHQPEAGSLLLRLRDCSEMHQTMHAFGGHSTDRERQGSMSVITC